MTARDIPLGDDFAARRHAYCINKRKQQNTRTDAQQNRVRGTWRKAKSKDHTPTLSDSYELVPAIKKGWATWPDCFAAPKADVDRRPEAVRDGTAAAVRAQVQREEAERKAR